MMGRACILAIVLFGALLNRAMAAERLSGETIRKLFEGNTVSGRYLSGRLFSEFHHSDGRALGHNGRQANTDACWTTTDSQVCYYYGPAEARTTHCFVVELSGSLYVLTGESGNINALATIESGNPRNHSDGGTNWYCDGNISQLPETWPRHLAALRPWRPRIGRSTQ